MNLLRSLQTALGNLRANKLRSALTMLGVIIGVSAVIVMVSIVEGLRFRIVQEFERLGSSLIIIVYAPDANERRKETRKIDGLTMEDIAAIERECDLIGSISAEVDIGHDDTSRYLDRESQTRPKGVQPGYRRLRDARLARGRFIEDEDMQSWAKVCVIGDKVREDLFKNEDPIGRQIEVAGINLTVIGVLQRKGGSVGGDEDKTVILPISTVQKRLLGRELVGVIYAQPRDSNRVVAAMDQVWQTLMRRYNNLPGFRVDSQESILRAIGRIISMFGFVLGGIAGLALLVGGIGIMNIMLVSVTERTREIGVRKSVGAKRRDILTQFLIEAGTLSGIGGLMGIAFGALVAWSIAAISAQFIPRGPGDSPGIPVHLPLWAVLGAFLFSAGIGVFFGIYPAYRASRLDPIQALRHE